MWFIPFLKWVLCVRHSTYSSKGVTIGLFRDLIQLPRWEEKTHAIATAENLDQNVDVVDGGDFTQLGRFW